MKPYQERVILEQKELSERIVKLEQFLSNGDHSDVDIDQKAVLAKQLIAMKEYNRILNERILLFTL